MPELEELPAATRRIRNSPPEVSVRPPSLSPEQAQRDLDGANQLSVTGTHAHGPDEGLPPSAISTSEQPDSLTTLNAPPTLPRETYPSPSLPQRPPGGSFSQIFSPPLSSLPNYLRRGERSHPSTYSPSTLQEVWSAANSPAYYGSDLTPPTIGHTVLPLQRTPIGGKGRGLSIPARRYTDEIGPVNADGSRDIAQGLTGEDDFLFDAKSRLTQPMETAPNASHAHSSFPESVRWLLENSSRPHEINEGLANLLHVSDERVITSAEWLGELSTSPKLLGDLFRAADIVTPVTSVLKSESPCAKIIDMLLTHGIDPILGHICGSGRVGAAGLRYLIRRGRILGMAPNRVSNSHGEEMATKAVIDYAFGVVSRLGADSLDAIPMIRLVESILPDLPTIDQLQKPNMRRFTNGMIRLLKRKHSIRQDEPGEVDPARQVAVLHLVSSILRAYRSIINRLEDESDNPIMPEEEWILENLAKGDIIQYLHDENAHPLVRCMALRVLRDFADVARDEVPDWENLQGVVDTCVDVLLWKRPWQHNQEGAAKHLEIAKFCPHDDAYQIITAAQPDLVMPVLTKALIVPDSSVLVEPLISLIVDHSQLKDKYWHLILSMLLHGGCLSLFHKMLLEPLPDENDIRYRRICRAKVDSCIGLTRCFEQMRVKDLKTIPPNIDSTLAQIHNDVDLPINIRSRANDASRALIENILSSLELALPILKSSSRSVFTSQADLPQWSTSQNATQQSALGSSSQSIRAPRSPSPVGSVNADRQMPSRDSSPLIIRTEEPPNGPGALDDSERASAPQTAKSPPTAGKGPEAITPIEQSPTLSVPSWRGTGSPGYGDSSSLPGIKMPRPRGQWTGMPLSGRVYQRTPTPEPQAIKPPFASTSTPEPVDLKQRPETSHQTRPRPRTESTHIMSGGSVVPEPEAGTASPYPQVKSHRSGESGSHFATSANVNPSRQPLPAGLMTPPSRPGTAEPWGHAPQDFQPPSFQAFAAAMATPPTAVSAFEKDFKTPRTIYEPISSDDQSSIYNPNSPSELYHSLSGTTPAPQYSGIPDVYESDSEPAPAFVPGGTASRPRTRMTATGSSPLGSNPSGSQATATGGSPAGFVPTGVSSNQASPGHSTATGYVSARSTLGRPNSVHIRTSKVTVEDVPDEDEPINGRQPSPRPALTRPRPAGHGKSQSRR